MNVRSALKQLNQCQKKWATFSKEVYAVVHALNNCAKIFMVLDLKLSMTKCLWSLLTAELENVGMKIVTIQLSEFGCCDVEYLAGKDYPSRCLVLCQRK